MKVAVIGVGGTGSAAMRFLAQAGHEVIGFEQFQVGHDRGSSHGESRIIRHAYADSLYTELMGDAYPLWKQLEADAGEELLVETGGLTIGPPDHPDVRAAILGLEQHGLPYETLTAATLAERYPAFKLRAGEVAIYQKDAGFLRAARCVAANVRLAKELGAELRDETPVRKITPHADGVVLWTEAGDAEWFDRAIVTAGAWMGSLLRGFQLPLRPTRQQYVYLETTGDAKNYTPEKLPVWIDAGNSEAYYGFPSDGRISGIKIAAHTFGPTADPDRPQRNVSPKYLAEIAAYAAGRFHGVTNHATYSATCLYTVTPDEDFILDRIPSVSNAWMVSGCSGHGFKFTVLLGKIAADLATGGAYSRDISRFSLNRFQAAV
ncbi:MAG: N-methyl-L-tryptophan oxidase [Capsulimonas sp.]|jgi:sarcosine oxidase|uniref:N-methyl-L-tryptophan oxidase n=1 Tax=Capsulimonas sp. TaxID=2494211 RepID=UPI003264C44E|nr:hypothetical protein [Capsulimonas sp.]